MADAKYLTVAHLSRKQLARFFSKITVNRSTGCWLWTGAKIWSGYSVTTHRAKGISGHRLMYAWLVEPLPLGRRRDVPQLDHVVCQTRNCCNPAHLELVSPRTNILRGIGISAENARKTLCKFGHPLRERKDRKGRYCPRCSSDASLASYYGGRRRDSLTRRIHTDS